MSILKFYFYPTWQCERLEKYLSRMEDHGYRLISIYFQYFLLFSRCEPKHARYFCTFTCLKEVSMNGIEYELRSRCHANPIPTHASPCMNLHRITDMQVDLSAFKEARRWGFFRVIFERFFFKSILITGLALLAMKMENHIILWLILFVGIFIFMYYIIGVISLYCKSKKYICG